MIHSDDTAAAADAGAESTEPPPSGRPLTRDYDELRSALDVWLVDRFPEGAQPRVSSLQVPESNGMSSDTVLFDLSLVEDGREVLRHCVARLEPEESATPVFPTYDFEKQFRAIRLVGDVTDVPVPPALWLELDRSAVGSPFFVMERVEGQVPPDVMPYTFGDNWFADATPEDQRALQDASLEVLARLHEVTPQNADLAFLEVDAVGDTALRRHVSSWWDYYEWVAGAGVRQPLIERCFAWLEDHWPAHEGSAVLSWGDARIGNILYREFRPVAVLDWEMAATGPREIDLGWMIFLHRFFQDLTEQMGLPGMPGLMRMDEAAATYEAVAGVTPRDLEFFTMYAALRHGAIMSRIQHRLIASGQAELPEDPDDLIMHRGTLEAMVEGRYWSAIS